MPILTLSLEEKYIEYIRTQAKKQKRDMSTIVEIALEKQMSKEVTQ